MIGARTTAAVAGTFLAGAVLGGGGAYALTGSSGSGCVVSHPTAQTVSIDNCADPGFSTPTPAPTDTSAPTPTDTPSPTPTDTPVPATPTPTVVPTPTPVVTPAPASFPDATNTGPTGQLRVISGNYTIPAGVTLSNVDITGSVIMNAGAKLLNSKVECANENAWCVALDGSNTVASDEIGPPQKPGTLATYASAIAVGIWGAGNTISKTSIHNTEDGLRVDNGVTVTDSWIHDLRTSGTVHSDGAQGTVLTNKAPIVFQHNTIWGGTNDALFMDSFGGPLTITGNQLLSANLPGVLSSHAIAVNHAPTGTTVTITGNVMSLAWEAGAISVPYTGPVTISGNTYTDGTPVN